MTRRATNSRIRRLAEHALTQSRNDLVRAAEILCNWTGLSFEFAFEAVDEAAREVKPE
jgi:hypothetical protein